MTKNTIFTVITITIIVIGWLVMAALTSPKIEFPNEPRMVSSKPTDPIPICPSCQRGTVREELRYYVLKVDNPEIYDSTGKRISGHALIDISTYKCYSCQSTYSWYHHHAYGDGYYTDGMKFDFFREE